MSLSASRLGIVACRLPWPRVGPRAALSTRASAHSTSLTSASANTVLTSPTGGQRRGFSSLSEEGYRKANWDGAVLLGVGVAALVTLGIGIRYAANCRLANSDLSMPDASNLAVVADLLRQGRDMQPAAAVALEAVMASARWQGMDLRHSNYIYLGGKLDVDLVAIYEAKGYKIVVLQKPDGGGKIGVFAKFTDNPPIPYDPVVDSALKPKTP